MGGRREREEKEAARSYIRANEQLARLVQLRYLRPATARSGKTDKNRTRVIGWMWATLASGPLKSDQEQP